MFIEYLKIADDVNVIDHKKEPKRNVVGLTLKIEGETLGMNSNCSKSKIVAFGLKELSVENPI